MEFGKITFDVAFVQWIVIAVIGIYTWINSRLSASNKEVSDLRNLVGGVNKDIAELKQQIKNMPEHKDLFRLDARLGKIEAGQTGISTQLDSINKSLALINDYLLNHK